MSFSIVEQIAQAIQTRIQNVTAANNYSFTVIDAARPLRMGGFIGASGTKYTGPVDGLVVIAQGEAVKRDKASGTGGAIPKAGRSTHFALICFIVPSEEDTTPADQVVSSAAAELERGITTPESNIATWGQFGGLAIQSYVDSITLFAPQEGEHCGVIIELEVFYRHPDNDPYTAA